MSSEDKSRLVAGQRGEDAQHQLSTIVIDSDQADINSSTNKRSDAIRSFINTPIGAFINRTLGYFAVIAGGLFGLWPLFYIFLSGEQFVDIYIPWLIRFSICGLLYSLFSAIFKP
jgi:hypothetical protein